LRNFDNEYPTNVVGYSFILVSGLQPGESQGVERRCP
jgi:hypothetical protein